MSPLTLTFCGKLMTPTSSLKDKITDKLASNTYGFSKMMTSNSSDLNPTLSCYVYDGRGGAVVSILRLAGEGFRVLVRWTEQ